MSIKSARKISKNLVVSEFAIIRTTITNGVKTTQLVKKLDGEVITHTNKKDALGMTYILRNNEYRCNPVLAGSKRKTRSMFAVTPYKLITKEVANLR
jgi:hypothetical protein